MKALNNVHMVAPAISVTNLNELVHVTGRINLVMNDLEDGDWCQLVVCIWFLLKHYEFLHDIMAYLL